MPNLLPEKFASLCSSSSWSHDLPYRLVIHYAHDIYWSKFDLYIHGIGILIMWKVQKLVISNCPIKLSNCTWEFSSCFVLRFQWGFRKFPFHFTSCPNIISVLCNISNLRGFLMGVQRGLPKGLADRTILVKMSLLVEHN